MSVLYPKADVPLESGGKTATDPKRTFVLGRFDLFKFR